MGIAVLQKRVDAGPPMCLTSFGDDSTESPALSCRGDAMVDDKSAAAIRPCISPVEMRMLTAAGGLLPAGTASRATKTIVHQRSLWFCSTEGMGFRTAIQYVTMYYSNF